MQENYQGIFICFFYFKIILNRDPNLVFVEAPALKPPEVPIDENQMKEYEAALAQASTAPLPDEEEDL